MPQKPVTLDEALAYVKANAEEHNNSNHAEAEDMYKAILRLLSCSRRLHAASSEYLADNTKDNLGYLNQKSLAFQRAARGVSPYGSED